MFQRSGEESVRGVLNNPDNYYRNLIIQDIALASQQAFDDIVIGFGYDLNFSVDQCDGPQAEIKVYPLTAQSHPLIYRGVDISDYLKPERADLVFHVVNEMGITSDSVLFTGIPVDALSDLYTVRHIEKTDLDGELSVRFSRAVFYFTRNSYSGFRDAVLAVDRYFAASALADSALRWSERGPLMETDTLPLLVMRRLELERIYTYLLEGIQPALGPEIPDFHDLRFRVARIAVLLTRYRTLERQLGAHHPNWRGALPGHLLTRYFDLPDHYHSLAFSGDFRNGAYLEELASPVFDNSFLVLAGVEIDELFPAHLSGLPLIAQKVVNSAIVRGERFEMSGNQIRALEYYESALKLALISGSPSYDDSLPYRICRLKKEIVNSYLDISRKAFQRDNPGMTMSYFREASSLIAKDGFARCGDYYLKEFEDWLYTSFITRSNELIGSGIYRKAIAYLDELNDLCLLSAVHPCPPEMQPLFRDARHGLYRETLQEALHMFNQEEFLESELLLDQAVRIRLAAGYRIARDAAEARLEGAFHQRKYDEFIEEGSRNLNRKEYSIALYYFNKADILDNGNLTEPDPGLAGRRTTAAREVIHQMMSDTRTRAMSYDFKGYESGLERVDRMLKEYGFDSDLEMIEEFNSLKDDADLHLCNTVRSHYDEMLAGVLDAKDSANFVRARRLAEETVQYSLEHLQCGLDDSRAWYEKVVLEPLAVWQEKDMTLGIYHGVSRQEYIAKYNDLRNYHLRNRLLNQGIPLETLHRKVMQADDPAFLMEFLQFYAAQPNLELALEVLKKLFAMGIDPALVAEDQKTLGHLFARRDAVVNNSEEPWVTLDRYIGQDKWFSDFRWSYRLGWISGTGWNLRYWPFIWKK
jgi:hypothetical protein